MINKLKMEDIFEKQKLRCLNLGTSEPVLPNRKVYIVPML